MKRLTSLIGILFNTMLAISQTTNFYETTKTFHENGYTYQCDVDPSGFVTLYNKNNKWTYVPPMKKGSNVPFYVTPENFQPLLEEDKDIKNFKQMRKTYIEIINNAFREYKGKMKGWKLSITTCTNSDTGKVEEVYFRFTTHTPFAQVPVSVYREIETKIVGYKRTPTELGKSLNYICGFYHFEVE